MKRTIIISLLIFVLIYLFRNLSFTAYNIRPIKECNKYLEKTYGKKFRRAREPVVYYGENGYRIWRIKYIDDAGIEFYEYYEHLYESVDDGFYPFFQIDYGEWGVRDYYWQQEIQRVYGETFSLEQYRVPEPSCTKYRFEIIDENDISEVANMIAVMLKYTFDNVEVISDDTVGYAIAYNGWTIYTIYEDMEELLKLQYQNEEDIYQYIYDKTYIRYQKKIERDMKNKASD